MNRDAFNLGWGYRFKTGGGWPTVEAMMVDMDGDGLLDRLTNAPHQANGGVRFCGALWERNLGRDASGAIVFGTNPLDPDPDKRPRYIEIPTLKWATEIGGSDRYAGGARARTNPSTGQYEQCSLNYQRTGYVNAETNATCAPSGTACPATGYCSTSRTDCAPKSTPVANTFLAWRWFDINGDGKTDLIGSPIQGGVHAYNLVHGTGVSGHYLTAPVEPLIFGTWPECPATPYTADASTLAQRPYTVCNGMFPYFVFLNKGNGRFGSSRPKSGGVYTFVHPHADWGALPDRIIYQPVPLETTSGDSSITAAPVGATQGTIDINGDGFVDAVHRPAADGPTSWSVFLNDRTGAFVPYTGTQPYAFSSGPNYKLSVSTAAPDPVMVEGLFDFHGDGVMDHWIASCPGCVAHAALGDGQRFRLPSGVPEMTTMRPGVSSIPYNLDPPQGWTETGWRLDSRSIMDVDGDGRADIAEFAGASTYAPKVYFNQGGTFATNDEVRYDLAVNRVFAAKDWIEDYMGGSTAYTWETRTGMLDLDGDGIPEGVTFPDGTLQMSTTRVPTPAQPARLLATINNGRGATTTITYSSMQGAAVVTNDRLKTMPAHQWVVQGISVADSIAGTTSTSTYAYSSPRYHADDRGTFGFRGFDSVTTTSPSGAKNVEVFSYTRDWSGRLVRRVIMPATSEQTVADEVRSIEATEWVELTLFNGLIKTYHATEIDRWACSNGQTEYDCEMSAGTPRTRTVSKMERVASTTGPDLTTGLMWIAKVTLLQTGVSEAAATATTTGTRQTTTTYTLVADETTYRLRATGTTEEELQAGGYVVYGKHATTWDSTYRVATHDDIWFSNPGTACTLTAGHCARSHRTYDMLTGNVLESWKPKQHTAGVGRTIFTYDSRKLFATTEVDEAGMQLDYAFHYGTGTKLLTAGPNQGSCASNPATCPAGTTVKEERRIVVDGLGRTIERWEPTSAQVGNVPAYTPVKVETFTYGVENGVANGTASTPITHTMFVDTSATDGQDTTDLDGHGRPVKKTVFVFGSAPVNHITTYRYRDDGTLAELTLPDPSQNNASTVTYRYTFDSLGRPTSLRRPDTTVLSQQSGVDIEYDALVTTTTEVVGIAGGQEAQTRTTNDVFGRLSTVEEKVAATPAYALTTYGYDASDRVASIVSPPTVSGGSPVTTLLEHDFADRRTKITRGTRIWKYGYDKNGNMVSESTPCSPMPSCDALHTTTVAYDALDRPATKYVAPRDMSSGDIALFGLHHEKFIWDYGVVGSTGNYKGRLIYWRTYSAASETSANLVQNSARAYQSQGQPTQVTEGFLGAGLSLSRDHLRTYSPMGAVTSTNFKDFVGGATGATTAFYGYDRRGLPSSASLTPSGAGGTRSVAQQTRNVAGLVTKRYAPGVGGPLTFVESNWTYDSLGRVRDQVVQKGPGPTQVARQSLDYFGNDDPKHLDHWLGATNQKHFNYSYDLRHQLTGVDETLHPNAFDAVYEYGPAGRFLRAQETAAALPGSDVAPRDVQYRYEGLDPEQVTSLVPTATPLQTYASYAFDLAGNQTIRCNGVLTGTACSGDSIHYVYDGQEQLRRATKKSASGATLGSEEYWYNGENQRVVTVKRDAAGAKTGAILWIVDVEAHYDGSGIAQRVYSHLSIGTPVVRVNRTTQAGVEFEFQYHGLATSTLATVANYTGTTNTSLVTAPFGGVVEATDGGATINGFAAHRRRFNDKFIDEVSDLTYYGFRYYDKTAITWTQSDPLYRFAPDSAFSTPRRALLYTAHLNNPNRFVDPDGRNPALGAGIGLAVESLVQLATWDFDGPRLVGAAAAGAVGGWAGGRIASGVSSAAVSGARSFAASVAVGPLMVSVDHAVRGEQVTGEQLVVAAVMAGVASGLTGAVLRHSSANPKANSTQGGINVEVAPASAAGRGGNKLKPDSTAVGPHSTWKRDPQGGKVTGHAEWDAAGNPVKRTDVTGAGHGGVGTPHTHEYGPPNVNPATGESYPGNEIRVRQATDDEIPQ